MSDNLSDTDVLDIKKSRWYISRNSSNSIAANKLEVTMKFFSNINFLFHASFTHTIPREPCIHRVCEMERETTRVKRGVWVLQRRYRLAQTTKTTL